jgi:transcriptional regulator with XRE-family HTH domain
MPTKERRSFKASLHQDPLAVAQARTARGLTQAALAAAAGISQATVAAIEVGTRSADPANLEKIAEVLDCPVEKLERRRPLSCRACGYRFDPQPNDLVPLHIPRGADEWCDLGGQPAARLQTSAA